MPNHALFSPLMHKVSFPKQTVRIDVAHVDKGLCVFNGEAGNQAHGIVPVYSHIY